MNSYQALWWQQARSDLGVLILLRQRGAAACHQLHYLQMVTEKLAKAYFWRSNAPPPRSHSGFVQFMRFVGSVRSTERQRIAKLLGFNRFGDLQSWIRRTLPMAYALERLAPTLAGDGPNPEYPWPQRAPRYAPATFKFDVWTQLTNTGRGHQLMQVIQAAIERFPEYG